MRLDKDYSWASRVIPFGIYMGFIPLYELFAKFLSGEALSVFLVPVIYTVKTVAVILSLILLRKSYSELKWESIRGIQFIPSLLTGLLVFILWINMDWPFATLGDPTEYDPGNLQAGWRHSYIFVRIFGAACVVPVMEELFWRSFILRYIISSDFLKVKLGAFTWGSFFFSSLLFGSEHNLWVAGIMAGMAYNILLYRTRNLYSCIFAHGCTNFFLALYVVRTGNWQFW